jgi:hypothetical protein
MAEEVFDERGLALVTEVQKYQNKWVAIVNYGGDEEFIVASGETLKEAKRKAEASGFTDATFLKVPPTDRTFIPNARVGMNGTSPRTVRGTA